MATSDQKQALVEIISLVKGQTALANELNKLLPHLDVPITQGHVWWWLNKTRNGVPPEIAPQLEAIARRHDNEKVTAARLRPDVFQILEHPLS